MDKIILGITLFLQIMLCMLEVVDMFMLNNKTSERMRLAQGSK